MDPGAEILPDGLTGHSLVMRLQGYKHAGISAVAG